VRDSSIAGHRGRRWNSMSGYPARGGAGFGPLQQLAGRNAKNITPRLHCKGPAAGQLSRGPTLGRNRESSCHLPRPWPLGFLDKSV